MFANLSTRLLSKPRDKYNDLDQQEARLRAELVTYSGRGLRTFLDYCEQECRAILGKHWPAVEAIALALLDRGSLDGDQLRAVWLASRRMGGSDAKEIPGGPVCVTNNKYTEVGV